MHIIQKQRKEPRVRQDREHRLKQRLEARPELRRLKRLLLHIDLNIEQIQDILELGRAFVQQRHVLQLWPEAHLERVDERVEVRVEDDELAEDGGEAGEEGREGRCLRLGELGLAPQTVCCRHPTQKQTNKQRQARAVSQ